MQKKEDNVSKETNEVREEPQVITSSPNTQAYDDNYTNEPVTSQLDMLSVQSVTTPKEKPMSIEEENLQYAISQADHNFRNFFPNYSDKQIMDFYKTTATMEPLERAMEILVKSGKIPAGVSYQQLDSKQQLMVDDLMFYSSDITAALEETLTPEQKAIKKDKAENAKRQAMLKNVIRGNLESIKQFFKYDVENIEEYTVEDFLQMYLATIGMTPFERAMEIEKLLGCLSQDVTSKQQLSQAKINQLWELVDRQEKITSMLDALPAEYMAAKQVNANTQNAYQTNNAEVKVQDSGLQR